MYCKTRIITSFIIILFCQFGQSQSLIEKHLGEKMRFRIHYGFINAAEAFISTDLNNGEKGVKINVVGQSTGVFALLSPVQDEWHAILNPKTWKPYKTSFKKREINYRKSQNAEYDYKKGVILVEDKRKKIEEKIYPLEDDINDMLGVYAEIRNEDFSNWYSGKKIPKKIFLEEKNYDLFFIVKGKDEIKINKNNIPSKLLIIQFPKNSFLSDKEDIRLWVSDDEHHIPLKIEVELSIGHLSIDLEEYFIKDKKIY